VERKNGTSKSTEEDKDEERMKAKDINEIKYLKADEHKKK
jgi:hypothetical protein